MTQPERERELNEDNMDDAGQEIAEQLSTQERYARATDRLNAWLTQLGVTGDQNSSRRWTSEAKGKSYGCEYSEKMGKYFGAKRVDEGLTEYWGIDRGILFYNRVRESGDHVVEEFEERVYLPGDASDRVVTHKGSGTKDAVTRLDELLNDLTTSQSSAPLRSGE